jgi:hypothetical protein
MFAVPFKANADRGHHIPKQQDPIGMDVVQPAGATYVEGREFMFRDLPARDGEFAAHSSMPPISAELAGISPPPRRWGWHSTRRGRHRCQ